MKLLDETLEYLKEKGIDPEKEVKWVGARDGKYAMSFAEFAKKFAEVDYYDQFGHQEIARDLVIVGEDWWLERVEYDGSEWWDLKKTPILSSAPKNFNCVRGDRLDPMLEDLNKDNGEQGNTKTPLIEDEEIRKAVRAWAEANGREKLLVIKNGGRLEVSDGSPHLIYISFHADEATQKSLDDRTYYTIEELCGEKE